MLQHLCGCSTPGRFVRRVLADVLWGPALWPETYLKRCAAPRGAEPCERDPPGRSVCKVLAKLLRGPASGPPSPFKATRGAEKKANHANDGFRNALCVESWPTCCEGQMLFPKPIYNHAGRRKEPTHSCFGFKARPQIAHWLDSFLCSLILVIVAFLILAESPSKSVE